MINTDRAFRHMHTTLLSPWRTILAAILFAVVLLPGAVSFAQGQADPNASASTSSSSVPDSPTIGSPTPLPYPSAALITATPLDHPRQSLLTQLYYLSQRADFKERAEVRETLCGSVFHRPDTSVNAVKAALTVAEADLHIELLFKKGSGTGVDTPGEKFSFFIEMGEARVLVRSSAPRFATEASGLSIPFPSDHTRPIWLEGKEGTNMLVLIPTVEECGVRSIALCPRSYDGRGALVRSKYEPVAARYFIKTKGDGLFSTFKGEPGRIMASVHGSPGVPVPEPFFKENSSANTATVTFKHMTPAESQQEFTKISLPAAATVESRLSFGTASNVQRQVWSRSTIEVTEMKLENWPKVHVRTADLQVENGPCYLVTQFAEKQL